MSSQYSQSHQQPQHPDYAPVGWSPQPVSPAMVQPKNGISTAALVLGIIGLVFSIILFALSLFSLALSVPAVVLGAVGIAQANKGVSTNRGSAITGLACGIIAISITFLMSWATVEIFG